MANKNDDVVIVDHRGNEYTQHGVDYGLTNGRAADIVKKLNDKKPSNIYDKHYRVIKNPNK